MALEIDGLAVLCAIAEAPEAFPAIRSDVTKAAHALVTKQLKARSLDLPGLRAVREALGPQPLALIVDGLKDAEVKALATRLDKHHPELKDGPAVLHRRHLMALAGTLAPVAAPAAKPKPVNATARKTAAKAADPRAADPKAADTKAADTKAADPKAAAPDVPVQNGPAAKTAAKTAAEGRAAPAHGKPTAGKDTAGAPTDALASAAMAARPPRRPRQQD
ncbi:MULTISPECIES: hypothetical protein [Methylobacterium]|jgi:hypothetical protein|uniref:hypothetical protein n=2 Tax=Methylobacteriaceae TaxID=119045 RepID=UPI0008E6A723|nr:MULTISPECIES: hypothetical protein [Methylobacterium]MBK3400675.1 hypothetical protein [Methylobacterium ajmalii]MBZ6412249.1 hypothetical protein [Methylobacterium sp.]SFE73846.1 hypothetical protein SAMN04487844_105203 [Methylobacterium sp. yr596]